MKSISPFSFSSLATTALANMAVALWLLAMSDQILAEGHTFELDCSVSNCNNTNLNSLVAGRKIQLPVELRPAGLLVSDHFVLAWGAETVLESIDFQVAMEALEFALAEFQRQGYNIAPFDLPDTPRTTVLVTGTGGGTGRDNGVSFTRPGNPVVIGLNQSRFGNRDLLVPTAAHELFHVLQFAQRPQGWWESAASFGAQEVYAEKTDYQSLQIAGYLFSPNTPLFQLDDDTSEPWPLQRMHTYGSYLFLHYLHEEFAPGDSLNKVLLQSAGNAEPEAFYAELLWSHYQARLPEVFSEFAARNSVLDYQQGWLFQQMVDSMAAAFPEKDRRTVATVPNSGTGWFYTAAPTDTLPQHFAYNTVSWPNPDAGYWNIQLALDSNGSQSSEVEWYPTVVQVHEGVAHYYPLGPASNEVWLNIEVGDSVTINAVPWSPNAKDKETFAWSYRVRPAPVNTPNLNSPNLRSHNKDLLLAQGTWQQQCDGTRTAESYFAGNIWVTEFTVYTGTNCSGFVWGKLRYQRSVSPLRQDGIADYDFRAVVESIELTLSPAAISFANTTNHYGYSDWVAGIPKAVSGFDGDANLGQVGDESEGTLSEFLAYYQRKQTAPAIDSAEAGLNSINGLWSRACKNTDSAETAFSNTKMVTTFTVYTEPNCAGRVWGYLRYTNRIEVGDYNAAGEFPGWPFVSTLENITLTLASESVSLANRIKHYGFANWVPDVPKHIEASELGFIGDQSHGVLLPEFSSMSIIMAPLHESLQNGVMRKYQRLH